MDATNYAFNIKVSLVKFFLVHSVLLVQSDDDKYVFPSYQILITSSSYETNCGIHLISKEAWCNLSGETVVIRANLT